MDRLFNAHVALIYEDERGKATVNSQIADRTELWWNPKQTGFSSFRPVAVTPARRFSSGLTQWRQLATA